MATRGANGEAASCADRFRCTACRLPPGARPACLACLSSRDICNRDAAPRTVTASVAPAPAPAARIEAAKSADRQIGNAQRAATTRKRSGWIIQIGAFEDASEAKEKLADAKKQDNLLKDAEPFTEIFSKGDKRYYRARFAGLREKRSRTRRAVS